ncbi:MAG: nitric oxide reductase activation protein NorD [Parahaliea sp.]
MGFSIEFEELVGTYWHRWVSKAASYQHFPQASVSLEHIRQSLAVFFRVSGGNPSLSVDAISERESRHRLSFRQRLGFNSEMIVQPRLDEEALYLPPVIDLFPDATTNRDLYFWLAAFFAAIKTLPHVGDPLVADILLLREVQRASQAALHRFPGLVARYRRLQAAALAVRPQRKHLPTQEAAIELALRIILGEAPPTKLPVITEVVLQPQLPLEGVCAAADYRHFLPVPLWGVMASSEHVSYEQGMDEEEEGEDTEEDNQPLDSGARKASRQQQDQAERDDPLIFNRFEKMLSFSEMVNLNRMVDDEPDENASKTAEQLDELTLSPHQKKAASRLQVELDLPAEALIEGELSGTYTYPEWNYRKGLYLPDQSQVHLEMHEEAEQSWQPDESTQRRVRRVQRQFEALRPRRVVLRAQQEGSELDTDAAVRGYCDQLATGVPSENVYLDTRPGARDLAVNVLVDNSLSTEAWLEDRRVIDVIQEALIVLTHGLHRCGDDYAITTFTSHRRNNVWLKRIKDFDETPGLRIDRRIAALAPGSYTRMGPAIRHAVHELAERPNRFRLLLLLSDGKPNDTDYYEGRYAIEDTRRAVLDARQEEVRVFGVTVDREAGQYIPRIFGRGGYALVDRPEKLSEALPRIYRQITTG